MTPRLLLTLALAGCTGEYTTNDKNPGDTGNFDSDSGETGDPIDTSETGHTGTPPDTNPPDTGDTGSPPDSGDSGSVDPGLAGLDVWPTAMVVNPGASYQLRVVATEFDGTRRDYVGATFLSSDSSVASVTPAGLVTAVAAGSTLLRVQAEGVEEVVSIEVRSDLVATVTVVDGATGAAIEGATVRASTGDFTTDAAGVATVTVIDGGPIMLTTWIDADHHAVSLVDTVSRSLTIPLAQNADDFANSTIHGTVDFSGVDDAGFGQLVAGVGSASLQGALATFQVEELLADDRTITVYGVEADAPANLFVEGYAEDYYADAFDGPVATWGMAGPLDVGALTGGLDGTGDALALLVDNMDSMSWGVTTSLTAPADATVEATLAPADRFSDVATLALPTLPAGFDGTEEYFVLTCDQRVDEGWVVTGMGLGTGVTEAKRVTPGTVPGSMASAVYAFAQVGGVGSGAGTSVAVADDDGGTVTFPDMLDIPVIDTWDTSARSLGYTVDSDAQLVRVELIDKDNLIHEIWTEGSWSGTFDKSIPEFNRGKATVQIDVYAGVDGTFEHWLATSSWDPLVLIPDRVARERLVHE